MKVVCINNNGRHQIATVGEIYEVLKNIIFKHNNEPGYVIQNDKGRMIKVGVDNFKTLREVNLDKLIL